MNTVRPRTVSGMRPTGPLHLGHYFGVLKNWVELQHTEEAYFFVADWHALTSDYADPSRIRHNIAEMVKDWVGAGLDPEKCVIFRQSAVKEHGELSLLLSMITPVSWLERNPTYKEQQQQISNKDLGNAGFLCYPVLMAADILLFDADFVPVGKDQVQHIEIAVDIAEAVNRNYGKELFRIPQPYLEESSQVIPGSDGRKMSKSYNNTIPLFLSEAQLKKQVMRIVTNSQGVEEVKDPDSCNVFSLYKLFATPEEQAALAARYRAGGMGWGDAKKELFDKMNRMLTPIRDRYTALMADPSVIDEALNRGAERARQLAQRKMEKLRRAVGL